MRSNRCGGRALDDSLPTVRLGAAITLSSFSERQEAGDAVPVRLGFLADNDPHRVEEAMGALWNLRAYSESTLMRWLHAHADDRVVPRQVHRAVELLGKIASPSGVEGIADLSTAATRALRFRALRTLNADVTALIAKFAHDSDPVVRKLALKSLRRRGVKTTGPLIITRPRKKPT